MKVKFNSWLKTKTGCPVDEIDPPAEVKTIADLSRFLAARYDAAASLFETPEALRYVVDRRYVDPSHELAGSQTIEIYPPVTGG
jgi:sulfur-carrier protein